MNRNFLNIFIFSTVVTAIFTPVNAGALTDVAKVTIRVLDEKGKPVQDARIGIGFEYNKNWSTGETGKAGLSDSRGVFSASAPTNGHIGWNITKDGYYKTLGTYDFVEKGAIGWKPWNPELGVVLRKIENPISMYARDLRKLSKPIIIPVADKRVGFDLVKCDWVEPYGKGIVSDFVFYLKMVDNSLEDYEYNLNITFSNEFDGIHEFDEEILHGSLFKLPRTAPLDGYNKEIHSFTSGLKRGARNSSDKNRHYIFRIRSEEEDGELKRAMYGKIISDIDVLSVRGSKMPAVFFRYYLNPHYTRNLEFDPNRNLFGPLPPLEQVGIQ